MLLGRLSSARVSSGTPLRRSSSTTEAGSADAAGAGRLSPGSHQDASK